MSEKAKLPSRGQLEPEVNVRLRGLADELVKREGNQVRAAMRLGIGADVFGKLLNGHGTSTAVARRIADELGLSLDFVMSLDPKAERIERGARLSEIEGYSDAAVAVRAKYAPAIVDAAERALSAVPAKAINDRIFDEACRLAISVVDAAPKVQPQAPKEEPINRDGRELMARMKAAKDQPRAQGRRGN